MGRDRITQLRISGLRAIEDLTLDLSGLTVLVGDNGTGKSTILEALELLRQVTTPANFVSDILVRGHGGGQGLLRRGADEIRLGATITGEDYSTRYDLAIGLVGTSLEVLRERLELFAGPEHTESLGSVVREGFEVTTNGPASTLNKPSQMSAIALLCPRLVPPEGAKHPLAALGKIEVHVPFETRPVWQQHELDIRVGPRWPSMVERSEALARYALNLPNVYQHLRNSGDDVWTRVIERARMGLGDDVRNFRISPSGRGNIELEVVFGSAPDNPLPVEYLSEGQVTYLAFLALVELHQNRSLLAFDEPEMHLHPALLTRVVGLLEESAEHAPVIVATHSDRLLDVLADPVASVVLCDLDDRRAVRLRRPNAEKLAEWLEDYRGFGSIRAEGYQAHVFEPPPDEEGRDP